MAKIRLTFRFAICLSFLLLAVVATFAGEMLIESGADWQYFDANSSPGRTWYIVERSSNNWQVGQSPFGVGDEGIATTLGSGDSTRTSYYFRRQFKLDDASLDAVAYLRIDDGCVVYLNGREVYRYNLPNGRLTHETRAPISIGGVQETLYHRVLLSRKLLRKGSNTIAVSVRQVSSASKDMYFDLRLDRRDALELLAPKLAPDARSISEAYRSRNYLGPEDKIPNGFLDGGPGMKLGAEGKEVSSLREVVLVDRESDEKLREYLEFVKSPYVQKLSAMERARRIAMFIDGEFSPKSGRDYAVLSSLFLRGGYSGQAVPIGEVLMLGGGGEASHRAVLFKVLGDAAGLDVALARGTRYSGHRSDRDRSDRDGAGRNETERDVHVWNELWLEDKCYLVDLRAPSLGFKFPITSKGGGAYLTTVGQAFYKTPSE